MSKLYLLDADNADYAAGKTTEPPATAPWILTVLWGMPLLLLAIGLGFAALAYSDIREHQTLEAIGKTTTAHYTKLPRTEFGQTGNAIGAVYEFSVDGKTFSASHSIPYAALPGTHEGDPVTIRYLADNPDLSAPVSQGFPRGFLSTAIVVLSVALVFGIASFKLVAGAGKDRERWKMARVVRGEVVRVDQQTGENDASTPTTAELTIAFKSPDSGQTLTQRKTLPSATDQVPHPEPGQAVAVRYLSDEEFRLL